MATTACRSTFSWPPKTVTALRPLDDREASSACSRATASSESLSMRCSLPARRPAQRPGVDGGRRPPGDVLAELPEDQQRGGRQQRPPELVDVDRGRAEQPVEHI